MLLSVHANNGGIFDADPSGLQTVPSDNKSGTCKWIHGPDLSVKSIDIQPPSGPSRTRFQVSITVQNLGDAAVTGGRFWEGSVKIDGAGVAFNDQHHRDWSKDSLPAGGETTLTFETRRSFATGTHVLSFESDPPPNNYAVEADETNNIGSKPFTITAP